MRSDWLLLIVLVIAAAAAYRETRRYRRITKSLKRRNAIEDARGQGE